MKTILFLDDEHALRAVLSEVLRNEGFTVLECADMAQALQACEEYHEPIDIAIVRAGYSMSSITEVARRYPAMRVLFIGDPEWKARVQHLRRLKPAWLPGPFTSEELLRTVRLLAREKVSHAHK